MSILLEALRKSEKSQHSREVPTIYADDHSGPVSESIGTGPLALLLVATLFITGWLVWRQYQPPLVDTQMPAVNAQSPVAGSRATAASAEPVARVGELVPAVTTPVTADEAGKQASTSSAVADSPVRQQRTPMESYQRPADSVAPSKSAEAETSRDTRPPAQTPDSGTGKPVEPATEKHNPGEPEPISYWELPDAIRADLPEIKFSVLVYANKPADRFVLVNGERLGEGDSPQPGLKVKEIRRDGVVFSYRLYQFLIER